METKKQICPNCKIENTLEANFCTTCSLMLQKNGDAPLVLPDPAADGHHKAETEPASGGVPGYDEKTVRDVHHSAKLRSRGASITSSHPDWAVRYEINARDQNEDSFQVYELLTPAFQETLKVFSIADGMGGHVHGERVSREVLRTVSHALFEQFVIAPTLNKLMPSPILDAKEVSRVLENALEEASVRIQRVIRSNKWGKAGSTIIIAVVLGNTLIAANLGDSPLFLYRHLSQEIKKITEDHTVAGGLVRKKIITPDMALHHEGRSRLEFFAGADSLPKQPPIYQFTLTPGDLVLLCSDGISGCLTLKQLKQIIHSAESDLETLADKLIEASLEADETDNQTLILWRYNRSSVQKAS